MSRLIKSTWNRSRESISSKKVKSNSRDGGLLESINENCMANTLPGTPEETAHISEEVDSVATVPETDVQYRLSENSSLIC